MGGKGLAWCECGLETDKVGDIFGRASPVRKTIAEIVEPERKSIIM